MKPPKTIIDKIVEHLEVDAARQAKAARDSYAAEMKVLRSDFVAKQREVAKRETHELKRIERWRVAAVATVQGLPVPLDDMRSVKREDVVTDDRGVSLPKLRCVGVAS